MAARTKRLFNAFLVYTDDQGQAHPYLAEAIPQLDSDSWKVAADGTMGLTRVSVTSGTRT